MCVEEYGAALINDISAGEMDSEMFSTVAGLGVPYIIMHMKGTPQTMQQAPHYDNLMKEIFRYFARKIHQLYELGVKDLILDPGLVLVRHWNTTTGSWDVWKILLFLTFRYWWGYRASR